MNKTTRQFKARMSAKRQVANKPLIRGVKILGSLPSFISELVRAANEFDRIGDFEKRRLLDRAYRTVQEMRAEVNLSGGRGSDYDSAIDFLTMSRSPDSFEPDDIKEALLDAADMIRTLKIVLEAKDEVVKGSMD